MFTCDDLLAILHEEGVKRALQAANTTATTVLHMSGRLLENNRLWKSAASERLWPRCTIQATSSSATKSQLFDPLIAKLQHYLNKQAVSELLSEPINRGTRGNMLKLDRPVLYVFPSGEGDSCLFALNGYSLLVNGGAERIAPRFWSFVSMLQQVDAVLVTHADSDALAGLSTLFAKKLSEPDVKPSILTVLANLAASTSSVLSIQAVQAIATEIAATTTSAESTTAATEAAATTTTTQQQQQSDVDLILDAINKLHIRLMPLVKNADWKAIPHQMMVS